MTIPVFGDAPLGDAATCCKRGNPNPTCGDKDGYGNGSDPDPVTDEECGNGWHYNPANADR